MSILPYCLVKPWPLNDVFQKKFFLILFLKIINANPQQKTINVLHHLHDNSFLVLSINYDIV